MTSKIDLSRLYDLHAQDFLDGMHVMFGGKTRDSRFKMFEENFGGPKLTIHIDEKLVFDIQSIFQKIVALDEIFPEHFVERWQLQSFYAVQIYIRGPNSAPFHPEFNNAISALIGFPLVEMMCQRLTGLWDDNGVVLTDIDEGRGAIDGQGNPKKFKVGQKISSFSQKLQLLIGSFPEKYRTFWRSLDNVTRRPAIPLPDWRNPNSIEQRLSIRRNSWSHGQDFFGNEGIILTMIIWLIYITCLDRKISEAGAKGNDGGS